jgi:histidinol phosphatase-like PHP family hydrolase
MRSATEAEPREQKLPFLSNSDIAELLSGKADEATYPLTRAFRRASRAAFLWPREAAEIVHEGGSLCELSGVGPFLEKLIRKWLMDPPIIKSRVKLRRNFFTRAEARRILKEHPDWNQGLRGDLQMHTEWSDGSGTVLSMAQAAVDRNYEYIAITDHGKQLKIAEGIDEEELREQGEEIKAANEQLTERRFRILRSIELNLDRQGNGDMTPEVLARLDLVLAAFHSALRTVEDQTERYLAAIRNPNVHILAHPRGRIYNYRLGLKADWDRVFEEAAGLGKAVEIDCYPDRQDLSFDLVKRARKAGVLISLGTDSHHPWQLEFMEFGLAAALAAKFPKDRILNFKPVNDLLDWAARVREQRRTIRTRRSARSRIPGTLAKNVALRCSPR